MPPSEVLLPLGGQSLRVSAPSELMQIDSEPERGLLGQTRLACGIQLLWWLLSGLQCLVFFAAIGENLCNIAQGFDFTVG